MTSNLGSGANLTPLAALAIPSTPTMSWECIYPNDCLNRDDNEPTYWIVNLILLLLRLPNFLASIMLDWFIVQTLFHTLRQFCIYSVF